MEAKHIALICDDNYCLPTGVCIRSIINNNSTNTEYLIHVCSFSLSNENISWLESISTEYVQVKVDLFKKELFEDRLICISQRSHVTPTALIKFELANYFSSLDSILYLDSDIVVKGDLLELFETDISKSYLAASYEFWKHVERISYSLSHKVRDLSYFNSGVMYLNLSFMREDSVPDKLWDYKLNKAKTTLMDQESFIAVCGQQMKQLSICWNFNPAFLKASYIQEINRVYHTNYLDCQQMLDDVNIIHYVGKNDKPWVYKNARLREFWDIPYNEMPGVRNLELREYTVEHRSKWKSMRDKVHNHGIIGLICNIIYNINLQFKR